MKNTAQFQQPGGAEVEELPAESEEVTLNVKEDVWRSDMLAPTMADDAPRQETTQEDGDLDDEDYDQQQSPTADPMGHDSPPVKTKKKKTHNEKLADLLFSGGGTGKKPKKSKKVCVIPTTDTSLAKAPHHSTIP